MEQELVVKGDLTSGHESVLHLGSVLEWVRGLLRDLLWGLPKE